MCPFYSSLSVTISTTSTSTIHIQATILSSLNGKSLQMDSPASILAYLPYVIFIASRVSITQRLIQIKSSTQKPPVASHWTKSQVFTTAFKAWLPLIWPPVPGLPWLTLLQAHRGLCHFPWQAETLLLHGLGTGSSLCLDALPRNVGKLHPLTSWRSLLKGTLNSKAFSDYPVQTSKPPNPTSLLSLPLLSVRLFISHTRMQYILYSCLFVYCPSLPPLSPT